MEVEKGEVECGIGQGNDDVREGGQEKSKEQQHGQNRPPWTKKTQAKVTWGMCTLASTHFSSLHFSSLLSLKSQYWKAPFTKEAEKNTSKRRRRRRESY
jgi:hypothetical protein